MILKTTVRILCLFLTNWTLLLAAEPVLPAMTGTFFAGGLSGPGFPLTAPKWADIATFNQPASFTPNDPLYTHQWHLTAANVQGAWNLGYSGAGVVIGIVDDGVQADHPDLRVSTGSSYNFITGTTDPSPTLSGQDHGTAVAGVAAAAGNNNLGVIGAAYQAEVAGLKVGFDESQTYQQFIDATLYNSSGTDPAQNTIKVKNHSYGIPSPYIDAAGIRGQSAALAQSAAAGTIHVLAAGNEGGDANWKRLQGTENAIVVAASTDRGTRADYSNVGANITVTAPSSGDTNSLSITTTDRTGSDGYSSGDYTSSFGGTSSSAPLVAGIMAMGVEANPDMDVRTAKHLLAQTSTKIDEASPYWNQNSAGIHYSPLYGFGQIDAGAFVSAAGIYTGVTERVTESYSWDIPGGAAITDRPSNDSWQWGLVANLAIAPGFFAYTLEEVIVTVSMHATTGHTWTPTELAIAILDPHGNQLDAAFSSTSAASTDELVSWNYIVNGFWGQDPSGTWLIGLADGVSNEQTGTLTELSMTFHTGQLVPEPSTVLLIALVSAIAFWIRRRFYE